MQPGGKEERAHHGSCVAALLGLSEQAGEQARAKPAASAPPQQGECPAVWGKPEQHLQNSPGKATKRTEGSQPEAQGAGAG